VFRDVTPRKKTEAEAELLAARLLTLDEERQRIALELHNSTAQHLLAMSLNLANLKTHIAAEPATLQLFGEITGSLQETTKEVRTFTYLLNLLTLRAKVCAQPCSATPTASASVPAKDEPARQPQHECPAPAVATLALAHRRRSPMCIATQRQRASRSI
jgi:hypothetical protein